MKMKFIGRYLIVAFVGAFVGNVFAAAGDVCVSSWTKNI